MNQPRRMIDDLDREQGAGHHQALDLVGSLVDLGDLSPGENRPGDLPGKQGSEQRKHVSLILTDSCCYPTSHGLETA